MFSIGEFSRITGMTIKTLRFYHEEGLLIPSYVDPQTGYRFYNDNKIDAARLIGLLRELDFSLEEIRDLLRLEGEDTAFLEVLCKHRQLLQDKLKRYRKVARSLDEVIAREKEAQCAMAQATLEVHEKVLDPVLIAGIRMRGKYSECGKAFGRVCRRFGRHICGKPMLLHFDCEFREDDADFEACVPIRKGSDAGDMTVRQLPGGHCVALVHQGPYDQLGKSYQKILSYIQQKGYRVAVPSREVYIKGPGMIFKGNPKKYLTEIQMLVESPA